MNPSLRASNMPTVDLSGQVAVVTGSNTGIGEQTAIALATAGAHVVLACRGMEKADAVAAAINGTCKGSAEALSLGTSPHLRCVLTDASWEHRCNCVACGLVMEGAQSNQRFNDSNRIIGFVLSGVSATRSTPHTPHTSAVCKALALHDPSRGVGVPLR
jgi:hypothetical protein